MDQASDQSVTELRFSRETLPGSDPIAAMKEYVGRQMIRCEIDLPSSDTPFDYHIRLAAAAGASWGRTFSQPVRLERTATLMSDGNDDLMMAFPEAPMVIRSRGRDVMVDAGEALLLSQARGFVLDQPGPTHGWSLRVPRKAVAGLVPRLGEAPAMRFAAGVPGLSLLRDYLRIAASSQASGAVLADVVGRHIQELAALMIGASGDYLESIRADTLAAVRITTMRADIGRHLGDPGLDLAWLARRHDLSPRQVQRLFAAQGTSFSDELRRMRVEQARRLLEDPRQMGRPVLAIALDCGFPEASALNRAFRQAYGMRPTDVRPAPPVSRR